MLAALSVPAAPLYRPGREYRTINTDIYEVCVQKNGRTDVTLASLEPVFANAYPAVWFDGDKAPAPLKVYGRWSARVKVNDRLGQGQGFNFKKDKCEWMINTYPTKPFLTVQVAFINTTRKPVKVKALIPWAVGEPSKGGLFLGPGTDRSAILDSGSLTSPQARLRSAADGDCLSLWNIAVVNPETRRSLIAGFLTNTHAYTQIRLDRTGKADENAFDIFRAECTYDPPVEVPPDGRIDSEALYLAIGESNPLDGLERFGKAVADFNRVRPLRRPLPHGWDSWSTKYETGVTEDGMLAALDFVDTHLKRYGWTHFSIDAGWELGKGNWEPDPEKFPHGMKWFAEQVHARGMTAGIWTDPFTVNLDTPLAKEHPGWLAEPNFLGRSMLGGNERILDITAPGAYEYVRDLYAKITDQWGYDALVETDFVYHLLLAESYSHPNVTRVDALRMGLTAIREGAGADTFIMGVGPLSVTGLFADGVRTGIDCAPIWRKSPAKWPWGCVETLTNAAQRYYFAPHVWAPDQDCAFFGLPATRERWGVTDLPELSWNQSIAWLTGAALTGGALKIGDCLSDLDERHVAVLRRLLPVPPVPARPIDLFERENPAIWSLPVHSTIGQWHIVAVFNWDEAQPQSFGISFDTLGLDPNAHYTVYDFWQEKYFGLARERLNVTVAPGSVHLLGLRRYENRPMFLATDRHFSMGATDFTALEWNAQTRRLSATFDGVANTDYNLRVLVPESYTPSTVIVSTGEAKAEQRGKVLTISFHCAEQGLVNWSVKF